MNDLCQINNGAENHYLFYLPASSSPKLITVLLMLLIGGLQKHKAPFSKHALAMCVCLISCVASSVGYDFYQRCHLGIHLI